MQPSRHRADAVPMTTEHRRHIGRAPCGGEVQKRQTSTPSTRPNMSAFESGEWSTPSARLHRDFHTATGPVLLPAPPGREHPTTLAARRRPQLGARRHGARLEWRAAPSARRPRAERVALRVVCGALCASRVDAARRRVQPMIDAGRGCFATARRRGPRELRRRLRCESCYVASLLDC